MSLTNDQLLERIISVESILGTTQTAITNLINKKELNALVLIYQKWADNHEQRLKALEEKVETIENETVL